MTALILLAALLAVVDWYAVWRDVPRVEALAKSLVPAALIAAVAVGDMRAVAVLVILALAFSLVGDIVLLPQINWFLAGLGSFLVTNTLLAVAFIASGLDPGRYALRSFAFAVIVGLGLGVQIVRAVRRREGGSRLVLPAAVSLYVVVQTAMLVLGIATGEWLAALGALSLAASDAVLGWNRFVAPLAHGRLKTHVPYHLALVLLALWAA